VIVREVCIVNQLGMHARAAAKFVHLATSFQSRIVVSRNNRSMDGKSIIGLLLLSAARGTAVTITVDGPDEERAAEALAVLVASGFGEGAWTD
jgi:phosphocarrier protein